MAEDDHRDVRGDVQSIREFLSTAGHGTPEQAGLPAWRGSAGWGAVRGRKPAGISPE
jgi:hypothetical protein